MIGILWYVVVHDCKALHPYCCKKQHVERRLDDEALDIRIRGRQQLTSRKVMRHTHGFGFGYQCGKPDMSTAEIERPALSRA